MAGTSPAMTSEGHPRCTSPARSAIASRPIAVSQFSVSTNAEIHLHRQRDTDLEDDPGQGRHLVWLHLDVRRHVHGDPGHPGGRNLAADDPECARYIAGCDELDSNGVSDR